MHANLSGNAAVEFALLAPIMFLLFLAGGEMAQAVMASRNVESLARTLADITARQPTCATTLAQCGTTSKNAQASLQQTDMETIFSAASAVMGTASLTPLTMTVTAVDQWPINPDASGSGNCCKYTIRWSYAQASSAANATASLRPCSLNPSGLTVTDTSPASGNGPSYTTISQYMDPALTYPQGTNGLTYQTVSPPYQAIIIADVTYSYIPPLVYNGSAGIGAVKFAPTMRSTRYTLPRSTGQVILSLPAGIGSSTSNPITTTESATTVYQNGQVCY